MPTDDAKPLPASTSLAIVVPVLDELARLPVLSQQLRLSQADQIILVDGGSEDGSWQWLQTEWCNGTSRTAVNSARGRALQMNAGAAQSSTDMLLFLHADTSLPQDAVAAVKHALHQTRGWGRFDVQFDSPGMAMRFIAWFINQRSRLTGIATGDQAIFVSRELFDQLGGFPNIALMEDIALCKLLKRSSKPHCLRQRVTTSARRWQEYGVIRTVILMWSLRLAYFLGVSPEKLARFYRNQR